MPFGHLLFVRASGSFFPAVVLMTFATLLPDITLACLTADSDFAAIKQREKVTVMALELPLPVSHLLGSVCGHPDCAALSVDAILPIVQDSTALRWVLPSPQERILKVAKSTSRP
ncbi:hypothetical protein EDB19DRAFT_1835296 [Suillus lakei]|nr:hypothetical protein EDB19DRAFT_1835296 [Suillus lakei]